MLHVGAFHVAHEEKLISQSTWTETKQQNRNKTMNTSTTSAAKISTKPYLVVGINPLKEQEQGRDETHNTATLLGQHGRKENTPEDYPKVRFRLVGCNTCINLFCMFRTPNVNQPPLESSRRATFRVTLAFLFEHCRPRFLHTSL